MTRVLAIATSYRAAPLETLRVVAVWGCALALIAAGSALPF